MQDDTERLREETLLWSDFQRAALFIGKLNQENSWKNLQGAALHTTQLYKNGVDGLKRAFERGHAAGRISLLKEICSLRMNGSNSNVSMDEMLKGLIKICRTNLDCTSDTNADCIASLYENAADDGVYLFQEALSPSSESCGQSTDLSTLNSFITKQIHRSRKRLHSSSWFYSKKKCKR